MRENLYIQHYCKIKNNQVTFDGKLVFEYKNEENDVRSFFKAIYKYLNLSYRKFYKMDSLSKLSFLASEFILDKNDQDKNISIVFSNNASSLDTDRLYQQAIDDMDKYYPSPAIFVYTLPNIGIGEISIKHHLQSENAFFVFNEYKASFHHNYEQLLVKTKKSDAVLAGWTNIDANKYEAFIYLVSKNGKIIHSEQNLNKLHNQ